MKRVFIVAALSFSCFFSLSCNNNPTQNKQNKAPNAPVVVAPPDGSTNQSRSITLKWSCTDPDSDVLSYDVYFGKTNPPVTAVSSNQSATSLAQASLDTGTIYYWKVIAKDPHGASTSGAVWSFTTRQGQKMVFVSGGSFQMGDTLYTTTSQAEFLYDEPVHTVTVSSFFIDYTEVTQGDYKELMGVNPSAFKDSLQPVEVVTWFDAALYSNARSRRDNLDTVYSFSAALGNPSIGDTSLTNLAIDYSKNGYRLPTEAEWEYACRGGTTTDFYWGKNYPPVTSADTAAIDNNSLWANNSPNYVTARVATKLPNPLGLYDMIGNVAEWCNEGLSIYNTTSQTDPIGPVPIGAWRMVRGGSFLDYDDYLLSARRNFLVPHTKGDNLGFRCVRR
jgi:formylglycine-generating enzyme required for sulfatase activity